MTTLSYYGLADGPWKENARAKLCLSVCLSICLSVYLSVCLFVCLSCLSVSPDASCPADSSVVFEVQSGISRSELVFRTMKRYL